MQYPITDNDALPELGRQMNELAELWLLWEGGQDRDNEIPLEGLTLVLASKDDVLLCLQLTR